MNSRRKFLLEILSELLIFICFNAVFSIIIAVTYDSYHVIFSYLLIIPFMFYSFIRRKIKKLWMFFILCLTTFTTVFFIQDLKALIIYIVYNIAVLIYTLNIRFENQIDNNKPYMIMLPLIFNLTGVIINYIFSTNISNVFFLFNSTVSIVCYILLTHITNIDSSLSVLSLSGPQPVKFILAFNNISIALFIFIIAIIAPLTLFIKLDFLWAAVSSLFLTIMKRLFSSHNNLFTSEENVSIEETPPQQELDMSIFNKVNEPSALFALIEKIFYYVLNFVAFGLLILLIIIVAYNIYKKFYDIVPENGDIKEFAKPIYKKNKHNFKKIIEAFPVFNKNLRIRRLFYKKVRSYSAKGVKVENDNTAQALSKKISKYEDISELTMLYEKARYLGED